MGVIREPDDWTFDKLNHRGKVFPTSDIVTSSGFTLIEVEGSLKGTLRQKECDFIYYIVSGSGEFVIDGETTACSAGDLVPVPAGRLLSYSGSMRMFLTSTPPWTLDQEEYHEAL